MGGFVFRFGFFVIAGTYLWTYFGGFLLTTNEKSHICKDRYIFQSVIHVHFFFGGVYAFSSPFDKLQTLDDLIGPTLMTCCQWNLDVTWIVQAQPQSGLGICLEDWVVVSHVFYFYPYLGKWSNLTNIFQMGWNHQLEDTQFEPNNFIGSIWVRES